MEKEMEFIIKANQVGTGPVATHPAAGLEPMAQKILGWLVEMESCGLVDPGLVDPAECARELQQTAPHISVEAIHEALKADFDTLAAEGYIKRVSDGPLRYQVTPAGRDAAIGYGALCLADEQDVTETCH